MKATLEIVELKNDVVTVSGNDCPCKDPEYVGVWDCPTDE